MESTPRTISWGRFPGEIQNLILNNVFEDGCSTAELATVSEEWRQIIAKRNFARIRLTPSRLIDFELMTRRNRAFVEYIWLCVELEHYSSLEAYTVDTQFVSKTDTDCIAAAIKNLFSALSTWEPDGELLLDISIYSPSDSKYLLKYLTLKPDLPSNECSSLGGIDLPDKAGLDWNTWCATGRACNPIYRTFNLIDLWDSPAYTGDPQTDTDVDSSDTPYDADGFSSDTVADEHLPLSETEHVLSDNSLSDSLSDTDTPAIEDSPSAIDAQSDNGGGGGDGEASDFQDLLSAIAYDLNSSNASALEYVLGDSEGSNASISSIDMSDSLHDLHNSSSNNNDSASEDNDSSSGIDFQEEEPQWWQQVPLVPAVTGVLLRQQTRRQWSVTTLEVIFAHLPRLQEVFYEPWRSEDRNVQSCFDEDYGFLFKGLVSQSVKKLTVFENSNPYYSRVIDEYKRPRIPSTALGRTAAKASLNLEHLSASHLIDARSFFSSCEASWKWANLKSLTLTSRLLAPEARPIDIRNMLRSAAAAAMEMPELETMELWNGRAGLAALFRYQSKYATVTWRSTWAFTLRPAVIQAWEGVAHRHGSQGLVLRQELLGIGADIKSHGDAIHYLELSSQVVRPVSLHQIREEHRVHAIWEDMRKSRRMEEELESDG